MQSKTLLASLFMATSVCFLPACSVVRGDSNVHQYYSDASITTEVKTKLVRSDEVSAARISVETQDGTVLLSGFVNSRHQAAVAIKLAKSVKGVKLVRNSMVVTAKN